MTLNEFLNTKVAEVMVKEVVSFSPEAPLGTVAQDLLSHQISGAPITDAAGRCVGVVSAVDIAGAEEKASEEHARLADEFYATSNLVLPVGVFEDKLLSLGSGISPASEQPVSNFMTKNLVTASADDSLQVVLQHMIDAHIHRVIVTDADGVLKGLVSTTDILAALLRKGMAIQAA